MNRSIHRTNRGTVIMHIFGWSVQYFQKEETSEEESGRDEKEEVSIVLALVEYILAWSSRPGATNTTFATNSGTSSEYFSVGPLNVIFFRYCGAPLINREIAHQCEVSYSHFAFSSFLSTSDGNDSSRLEEDKKRKKEKKQLKMWVYFLCFAV